jgi:fucose permease
MPYLAADLGVSLAKAGLLLTALFGGSIAASGAVAWRLHYRDGRGLGMAGLAVAGVGLASLAAAPGLEAALAGALLLGIGDGLVTASSHGIMATTSDDVPRAITRLNVFFALGAIAGPLWSGAILEVAGDRTLVFGGAAGVAGPALALLAMGPAASDRPPRAAGGPKPRLTLMVASMSAVLFLYVGAEMGLGAWVASYTRAAAGAGVMAGAAITAGYWGALAAGRLLAGALLARGHGAGVVPIASIAGAGVASLAIALSGGELAVGAPAALLTGLCFGPVWPVAMAIGASGARAGTPAFMVTAGNSGGVIFPWAQGLVLSSVGPGEGMAATAALCGMMLALAAAALWNRPPANARP